MSIASCGLDAEAAALVASPRRAAKMLDYGIIRIDELISSCELESFKDGKSRKIVVASIHAYVERRLAEARAA